MAWAQSQKEIDELKELAQRRREEAEARKQLNDAENRIDVATDQNNVRADRQQLQRQAEHERSLAARQRFADSHALTAVSDPGRYSPQAYKAAKDYLENRGIGRTRYEFDEAQRTARQAATEKARGMIGQGREAAEARAAGDRSVAEIGAASAQRTKELEAAAQKELGAMDAASKRYAVDAEHGTRNEDGTVTPGSRERVEQIRGEHQMKAEQAKGAALAESNRLDRQSRERIAGMSSETKQQKLDAQEQKKRDDARSRVTQGILEGRYTNMTAEKWQGMTREDQDKWLRSMSLDYIVAPDAGASGTGQKQGGNPANGATGRQGGNNYQEGETAVDPKGRRCVFHNGRWVRY